MGTLKPQTIVQQYGDWHAGRWWVGCYIWYNEQVEPGTANFALRHTTGCCHLAKFRNSNTKISNQMILVINSSNHISADKRTLGYGFLFAFYSKYCRKFGERCFSHAGPAAWNTLPDSIKLII